MCKKKSSKPCCIVILPKCNGVCFNCLHAYTLIIMFGVLNAYYDYQL